MGNKHCRKNALDVEPKEPNEPGPVEIYKASCERIKDIGRALKSLVCNLHRFNELSVSHSLYTALWAVGAAALIINPKFRSFFHATFDSEGYGEFADAIRPALMIFGILTIIVHQGFIYQSLIEMDHNRVQYETDFCGFFGTKCEWIIRMFIMLVLFATIGKITTTEDWFNSFFRQYFHVDGCFLVIASIVLFGLLSVWNTLAGIKSKKWKFWLSDLLAFFYWLSLLLLHIPGISKAAPWALGPILVTAAYFGVILKRSLAFLRKVPGTLNPTPNP